jgi:hypothetical protein
MARPKLTGAGQQRQKALEESMLQVQMLHGLVERMAMAHRQAQPLHGFVQQFKRAVVPLTDLLKGQYGPIADQVTHMVLIATRGGNDRTRVNALREGLGSVKSALDVSMRKLYEDYAEEPDEKPAETPDAKPAGDAASAEM